jgi:hypothetical protein
MLGELGARTSGWNRFTIDPDSLNMRYNYRCVDRLLGRSPMPSIISTMYLLDRRLGRHRADMDSDIDPIQGDARFEAITKQRSIGSRRSMRKRRRP